LAGITLEPVGDDEVVILFGPQESRQCLALDAPAIKPSVSGAKNRTRRPRRCVRRRRHRHREPDVTLRCSARQADGLGLSGARLLVPRACLGAALRWFTAALAMNTRR
jgi:hypothetical protein